MEKLLETKSFIGLYFDSDDIAALFKRIITLLVMEKNNDHLYQKNVLQLTGKKRNEDLIGQGIRNPIDTSWNRSYCSFDI